MTNEKIQETLRYAQQELGEGLVAIDFYSAADAQSLAGINNIEKGAALFSRMTSIISKALAVANFDPLQDYYMMHYENNATGFVLLHDEYQIGIVLNTEKAKLGIMVNLVIPGIMEILRKPE